MILKIRLINNNHNILYMSLDFGNCLWFLIPKHTEVYNLCKELQSTVSDFIYEPHTYWLRNEVTKEEYELVEKNVSQFELKRTEEMERLVERFKNTDIKPNGNSGSKLDLYFYCQKQQQNIMATRAEMNKECGKIPL